MTPGLDPELEAGLRRLRLRGMRELAPELLQTAKTQRWAPQELLGTLVREEIASREASNERARLKAAGFPAPKTLDAFDLKASQLPQATFEFLASLEWLERKDNLCLAGPAGIGKSHLAQALGRAAITAGHKVRFFQADQLIEALYRGLADNTVGRLIERLLRHDFIVIDDLGFTAMDRVAADHLFRFIAAAYGPLHRAARPQRRPLTRVGNYLATNGDSCWPLTEDLAALQRQPVDDCGANAAAAAGDERPPGKLEIHPRGNTDIDARPLSDRLAGRVLHWVRRLGTRRRVASSSETSRGRRERRRVPARRA